MSPARPLACHDCVAVHITAPSAVVSTTSCEVCCTVLWRGVGWQFAPRSLGLFTEASAVRQLALSIVLNKWFDRFILLTIVINSVFLSMIDYRLKSVDPVSLDPVASASLRNSIVSRSEPFFTAIYATEAALKIIGMGFVVDKGSYLSDRWNW